jgi:hypothetical protein
MMARTTGGALPHIVRGGRTWRGVRWLAPGCRRVGAGFHFQWSQEIILKHALTLSILIAALMAAYVEHGITDSYHELAITVADPTNNTSHFNKTLGLIFSLDLAPGLFFLRTWKQRRRLSLVEDSLWNDYAAFASRLCGRPTATPGASSVASAPRSYSAHAAPSPSARLWGRAPPLLRVVAAAAICAIISSHRLKDRNVYLHLYY